MISKGYKISSFWIITILLLAGLFTVFGLGSLAHMVAGSGPVTVVSTAITSCTDCTHLTLNINNPISKPDITDQLYVTLSAVGGDQVGYTTLAIPNGCPCVEDSWGEMAYLRARQVSTLDAYVAMYSDNLQTGQSVISVTVTNPIAGNFVLSALIVAGINPYVNYQASDNAGDCSGSCTASLATGMPLANGITLVGFAADGFGVAGTISPTPAFGFSCVGNCGSNNQLTGGTMEYSTNTGGSSSQLPMSYSNGNNGWVLVAVTFFANAGTSFSNTTCQSYCNSAGNSGLSLGQLLWLCQTGYGSAPPRPTACGTNSSWTEESIYDASNGITWEGCSGPFLGCAGFINNVYAGEWVAWHMNGYGCAPNSQEGYDPVNVSQTTVRDEGGWCVGQIDPSTATHVLAVIVTQGFTTASFGAAFALPSGITSSTPYYVLTNSTGSTGNVQFSDHYIAGSIYFVAATTYACVFAGSSSYPCTIDTYTAQNGYQQMWQQLYATESNPSIEGNWAGFISNSEPAPYSDLSPAIENHGQYSIGGSNVMIIWWPVGYACSLAPPHVETTGANTTSGLVLPDGVGGSPAAAPYVEATISPNYYCPNDVFMIGAHTNMTNFNGQSFSSVRGFTTTVLRYNYQAPWTTIMAEIQPTTACEFGCSPVHIRLSDTHVFQAGLEVVDVHAVSIGTNTTYGTNSTTCGCSVPPSRIGFFSFETLSSGINCYPAGFGHACYSATPTTGFISIFSSEPDNCGSTGCNGPANQVFMSAYAFFPNPSGTTTAPMSTNAGSWTEILLAAPSQTPIYSCVTSSSLFQVGNGSSVSVSQVTNGSSVTSYLTADGSSVSTSIITDGSSTTTSTDGTSVNNGITTTTVYADTTSTFTANITTTTTTVDTTVTTYSVTNETYTIFSTINSYTLYVNCVTSGSYSTIYNTYTVNGTTTVTSTITSTLYAFTTTIGTIITISVANPNDIPNLFYALLLIILMLAFAVIVLVRRSGYLGGGGRYVS